MVAPILWNPLPIDTRRIKTMQRFKICINTHLLKTFLQMPSCLSSMQQCDSAIKLFVTLCTELLNKMHYVNVRLQSTSRYYHLEIYLIYQQIFENQFSNFKLCIAVIMTSPIKWQNMPFYTR